MKKITIYGLYYKAHRHYNKRHMLRAKIIYIFMRTVFSCDIPYSTKIGKNTQFPHYGLGVVINPDSIIGENCKIGHNVTIGGRGGNPKTPIIGNNVLIGSNAIIIGDVKIGDGAKIGAGSVVLYDVPNGATVVGNPAKIIIKSEQNAKL